MIYWTAFILSSDSGCQMLGVKAIIRLYLLRRFNCLTTDSPTKESSIWKNAVNIPAPGCDSPSRKSRCLPSYLFCGIYLITALHWFCTSFIIVYVVFSFYMVPIRHWNTSSSVYWSVVVCVLFSEVFLELCHHQPRAIPPLQLCNALWDCGIINSTCVLLCIVTTLSCFSVNTSHTQNLLRIGV